VSNLVRVPANMIIKPPLKWAGGKRWLVPRLSEIWVNNQERRYIEPFCGALAMPLGLLPKQALLNDFNPHLINFYLWLQKGLEIEIEMKNEKELFYQHRTEFNRLIENGLETSKRAAELFYYLNRTCYNGLCRFNRKGEFNVPFGKYKTINYAPNFYLYKDILADWEFTVGDFENVKLKKGDFVYADPPYDVEFVNYAKDGFSWSDQVRLAKWLSTHQGPVVASNQATPRILELYISLGFEIEELDAPRRISSDGNRASVKEMLAIKCAGA
jgi:DNA adenine methylase